MSDRWHKIRRVHDTDLAERAEIKTWVSRCRHGTAEGTLQPGAVCKRPKRDTAVKRVPRNVPKADGIVDDLALVRRRRAAGRGHNQEHDDETHRGPFCSAAVRGTSDRGPLSATTSGISERH